MGWGNDKDTNHKLINISKHFSKNEFLNEGKDMLVNQLIKTTIDQVIYEVRIGLGLVNLPKNLDIGELSNFNKIADIYEEAADNCYFCSSETDPNKDEFGPDTKLCLMCKLKLTNFTQALGIKPSTVFDGIMTTIQKSSIKFKTD